MIEVHSGWVRMDETNRGSATLPEESDSMEQTTIDTVREIMTEFARLTGLADGQAPKRYLWTDAFAACNFLELYRQTGEECGASG